MDEPQMYEASRVRVLPNGECIIFAHSLRGAASDLENAKGVPIERMDVNCYRRFVDAVQTNHEQRNDELIIRGNNISPAARGFRRFVAAVEGTARGTEGRVVRGIRLISVYWDEFATEDIERLVRDVLPNHPTLELVGIDAPPAYVTILANSLRADTTHPLRELSIWNLQNRTAVQAIADMVRRNVPLTKLVVTSGLVVISGCQWVTMDAADGMVIAQAVARNPSVRALSLEVKDVQGDTLEDLMASPSLKSLVLTAGTFSDEFVARFSFQLRANSTLEFLSIKSTAGGGSASPLLGAVTAVLKTYNVTIRSVSYNSGYVGRAFARDLTRRNRWIRRMVAQLEPRNYHVEPMSAWPLAVGKVSGLPTLVYRFVRRGYVNALCNLAPRPAAAVRNRSTRDDKEAEEEGRPRRRRRRMPSSRMD